jgi:hypothetical protein
MPSGVTSSDSGSSGCGGSGSVNNALGSQAERQNCHVPHESEGPPGGGPSPTNRDRRPVYGRVNSQALRPCVAAYSFRAPDAMVSPATSTCGSPLPATTQVVDPFTSLITPKSLDA